jgi:hypothetical protein
MKTELREWIPAFAGMTLLLVSSLAFAQSNGGYAGAFLRMGLGAEAIAQGDAFTARANNGFAGYYNPAGLPHLTKRHFAVSYSNLALDRSFNFVGLSFPLKPTAGVAVGWINAGVNNIDGRDFDGEHYGDLEFAENAFTFAFANRFSKYVSAGVGVKILYDLFPRMLEEDKSLKATGVGFDFGALVKPSKYFQIGLQARDINAKYGWDSSQYWNQGMSKNDKFPTLAKCGIAIFPYQRVSAEYDLEMSSQEVFEHHFGFEYSVDFKPEHNFALRTGLDQDCPTFGLGYDMVLGKLQAKLDLAYIMENISPEDTMIFSWSLLF